MGNAQSGVSEGVFCDTTDASCCDLNGCEQVQGRLLITGFFFENVLPLRLLHTRVLMGQRSAYSNQARSYHPGSGYHALRLLIAFVLTRWHAAHRRPRRAHEPLFHEGAGPWFGLWRTLPIDQGLFMHLSSHLLQGEQ